MNLEERIKTNRCETCENMLSGFCDGKRAYCMKFDEYLNK